MKVSALIDIENGINLLSFVHEEMYAVMTSGIIEMSEKVGIFKYVCVVCGSEQMWGSSLHNCLQD